MLICRAPPAPIPPFLLPQAHLATLRLLLLVRAALQHLLAAPAPSRQAECAAVLDALDQQARALPDVFGRGPSGRALAATVVDSNTLGSLSTRSAATRVGAGSHTAPAGGAPPPAAPRAAALSPTSPRARLPLAGPAPSEFLRE
jgi:hypothetical protein